VRVEVRFAVGASMARKGGRQNRQAGSSGSVCFAFWRRANRSGVCLVLPYRDRAREVGGYVRVTLAMHAVMATFALRREFDGAHCNKPQAQSRR
jgi:hypothetical protein